MRLNQRKTTKIHKSINSLFKIRGEYHIFYSSIYILFNIKIGNKSNPMSNLCIDVLIQICSNCHNHRAYTRHVQQNYNDIASDILKIIKSKDSEVNLEIVKVGQHKIGAFEITCNDRLIFSKLKLGYFPDVFAVTDRLLTYISEIKQGLNNSFLMKSRVSQSAQKDHQNMTNRSLSSANFSRSQLQKPKANKSNHKIKNSDHKNPQNKNEQGKTRTEKFYQIFKQKRAHLIEEYKKKYPHRNPEELFVGQKPKPVDVIYTSKPYPEDNQQKGYERQTKSWERKKKEEKQGENKKNEQSINIGESIINNKGGDKSKQAKNEVKIENAQNQITAN